MFSHQINFKENDFNTNLLKTKILFVRILTPFHLLLIFQKNILFSSENVLLIMSRKTKLLIYFILIFFAIDLLAQPAEYRMSRKEYIEKYREDAIKEMLEDGVPASITIAQGIVESSDGNSPLAKYANNHFGIKCRSEWAGPTFTQDDDAKNECFRKYYTVYDSYRDHSDILKSRRWYAPLFALKRTDYKGWAYGLKKAGYATNPKYADMLIKIIEDNKLYEYDKLTEIPNYTQQPEEIEVKKLVTVRASVEVKNNLKYIIAKPNDTPFKIAKDFKLELWQVYKYNDLKKEDKINAGEIVYLQPKHNKAKEKIHTVRKAETMRSISQLYGIKLKKLYRKNNMKEGEQPKIEEQLYLRKRRSLKI